MSEVVVKLKSVGREEAVETLVAAARGAVDAFRESYRCGVTVDMEFHRSLQRLHLACEMVEHLK